ncbi:MAG: hypothetical protein ACREPD_06125 [Stenotrophomonas sp.]|uniref:hypothetical protein n=1 Tax=Stenotrophomonas sp. TaxID=69392 RepID=UPI003D6DA75E
MATKLLVLALLFATAVAAGLWAGNRWAEGGQAIKDRAEQKAFIGQLEEQVAQLHTRAASTAIAYAEAIDRMNTISTSLEQNREENRKFAEGQRAALASLLDRRPELRTTRAGDDVLQHWNQSNQGKSPAAAPASNTRQSEAGMPGAADGSQRPVGNPPGKPRPGGVPLSRLQRSGTGIDPGNGRMGGHSLAVVLPSAGDASSACGVHG